MQHHTVHRSNKHRASTRLCLCRTCRMTSRQLRPLQLAQGLFPSATGAGVGAAAYAADEASEAAPGEEAAAPLVCHDTVCSITQTVLDWTEPDLVRPACWDTSDGIQTALLHRGYRHSACAVGDTYTRYRGVSSSDTYKVAPAFKGTEQSMNYTAR